MGKLASFVVFITLLGSTLIAQQSTTGPVPPAGLDPGLKPDKRTQTVISGVPTYLWQHGCGPTALGMVIGYYDSHGFPTLVPGDATTQNSAVDAMIADDSDSPTCGGPASDHYQDYACPIDYSPYMQTDRSQTGGAHSDNCVADFMKTSRSAYGNFYGWSWFDDMDNAFRNYVNYIDPALTPYADNYLFWQFSWEDYMTEIDNNRPVVLLVDTDGDGSTDHFITAVGYDDAAMAYGLYNTWDYSLHWYPWREIEPGSTWGIYGVTVLSLGQLTVNSTSPAHGETGVNIGTDISVAFNLDMDVSTLNQFNILVFGSGSGVHDLSISYFQPTYTVNIHPETHFSNYEMVEVILSSNIRSLSGVSLGQDFVFDFNTGSCCIDLTGNVDCSPVEQPDISDITRLIDYLYLSHNPLCCLEEADVDVSGGEPDISDITYLIDHLYLSHRALYSCPGK
jgi:hypothetical protein